MQIGLPKEIKVKENRVALTPGGVGTLVRRGHSVVVQEGAGVGSGLRDQEYIDAGATIGSAEDAWAAEMVVKVKEPIAAEYKYLRDDLLLFTYLHLAADRPLTEALLAAGTTGVAYETVQAEDLSLPLLTPMSEVAGRLSVQAGAYHLQKPVGGRGVLLGGVPGVQPGHVVILGGGVVGTNAAKMAMGLGARVTILDVSHRRLTYLDDVFFGRLRTMMSSEGNIRALLPETDLLIGAVLIPGAKAPHLVTRDMLGLMQEGSVIADVAVDQGGCVETIHATTHDDPTYVEGGVVHYGVANMPGAVPRTSTFALTNATFPYVQLLADHGLDVLRGHAALQLGVNTHRGQLTYQGVADAFGLPYVQTEEALGRWSAQAQ
ncbi:alanine dehydrogenase [Deinococcus radiopugnans]|uniref:Alanine dehydrogenase n=1 Tax=Deinococcus radiopugnans ATCC 19172 TaxID=585398 RepID=A0A5C4Y2L5_9DEIO|nr:alanine dehydrogenase [Deinococcus radiopugnans]MBB6017307.1 alanine dehydrogenase [Deinococcus radiopugnans ATCC 19172]QLG09565.1 alanine dehydrogenase [Deinococcus sp. D7000]TNM70068.1 alanine dehydrogenase [Deinococcus radiopugnans ATCC 19172]